MVKKFERHGMKKTRLYNIYRNILARCNNPKSISYKWYGDKGIKVCDSWQESPRSFFEWAKTSGYGENLQIDRIDNGKGYSPENCRWVTPKENSSNKDNNLKYKGETATMASERLGGTREIVSRRVAAGWDIEKAFITPINKKLSHPKK